MSNHGSIEPVELAMRLEDSVPNARAVLQLACDQGAIAYDQVLQIYYLPPKISSQQARLGELEAKIESGLKAFCDVGEALREIQKDGLYKQLEYSTFEEYCLSRWGMKRDYAYKIIAAAEVMRNLYTIVDIGNPCAIVHTLPTNEAQVRPLTRLKTRDQQRDVWAEAVSTAPNGKITASHVQRTAQKHRIRQQKKSKNSASSHQESYNQGDLVLIQTRYDAEGEQKSHNGCIAVMISVGSTGGTIEVETKGERIRYMADDTKPIENPADKLREAVELLNKLYKREDLHRSHRAALQQYWQWLNLDEQDLDLVSHIWELYHTEKGNPENIRARVAEHFILSDRA